MNAWTTVTRARLRQPLARLPVYARARYGKGTLHDLELLGGRLRVDDEARPWASGTLTVDPTGTTAGPGTVPGDLLAGLPDLTAYIEVLIFAGYDWGDGVSESHAFARVMVTRATRRQDRDGIVWDLEVASSDLLAEWEVLSNTAPIITPPGTADTPLYSWWSTITPHLSGTFYTPSPTTAAVVPPEFEVEPHALLADVLDGIGDVWPGTSRRWRPESLTANRGIYTFNPPPDDLGDYPVLNQEVIELSDVHDLSRWANNVVVEWPDKTAVSQPLTGQEFSKTRRVERAGITGGMGASGGEQRIANNIRNRLVRRNYEVEVTTRAHWGMRPGQGIRTARALTVRAVEFDLGAGTMTYSARVPE